MLLAMIFARQKCSKTFIFTCLLALNSYVNVSINSFLELGSCCPHWLGYFLLGLPMCY